jgi:5-methylcytosine-specific restriction endonuclease McrA
MERTLLLNQGYEPLTTISWQKAICLLTLGKVEVVEEYDREIRSVYLVIKMPAVVRLITRMRRRKQRIKFSRQNVLARDRWRCQYCGRKRPIAELTYDHVVPRSQGGRTNWENIVTACEDCNARKRNRTPREAGMKLRQQPFKPTWVPLFTIQLRGPVPDQWASYLYWSTELDSD